MAYRYVVTREWGDHKVGDRLESVDNEHAHFVVRVPFSDAVEPPVTESAQPLSEH